MFLQPFFQSLNFENQLINSKNKWNVLRYEGLALKGLGCTKGDEVGKAKTLGISYCPWGAHLFILLRLRPGGTEQEHSRT